MRVMICLPGDNFKASFVSSFIKLQQWMTWKRIAYTISMATAPNLYHVRNKSFGGSYDRGPKQLPFDGQEYDFILTLDQDQTFAGEDLGYLLEHNVPIVGGTYKTANIITTTCGLIKNFTEEIMEPAIPFTAEQIKNHDKTKLLSVDYLGFGFTLIRRGILERFSFPWIRPEIGVSLINGIKCEEVLSEDIGFCRSLARQDIPRWVDCRCSIGHDKSFVIRI